MAPVEKYKGTTRLMLKLEESLQDKKFYEAHQVMRTLNFRYRSAHKIEELETLLIKTANTLLDCEQYESGTDVGNMLAQLCLDSKLSADGNRIYNLISLLQKMQESPERVAFIANVIEWTDKCTFFRGEFSSMVARIYINECRYREAWNHILRMTDVQQIVDMVTEITVKVSVRSDEIDLVVAIVVLSILVSKRTSDAEAIFTLLSPRIPSVTPLTNALRFTIEAAKIQHAAAYNTLKQVYWPTFNRVPTVSLLFVTLGSIVFKTPKTNKTNGLMDDLFSALSQTDSTLTTPSPSKGLDQPDTETLALD